MRAFPKSAFPSDAKRAIDGANRFDLPPRALHDIRSGFCELEDAVAQSLAGDIVGALIEQEGLSDQILAVLVEGTEEYMLAVTEMRNPEKTHPEKAALREDIRACVESIRRPAGYYVDVSHVIRFRHRFDCKDHDRNRTHCEVCAPVTAVEIRIGAPLDNVKERVIVVALESSEEGSCVSPEKPGT